MSGKTHLWLTLVKNQSVFKPRPSCYFIFGNSNLAQFDHLKEHFGEENVHIHSVRALPDMVQHLPQFAFVLLDEVNSAMVGLGAKEKNAIFESIKALYCEHTHHAKLFLITILQQAYKSKFFELIGQSQSLALSTFTSRSIRLLRDLELDSDVTAQGTALLRMLNGIPQFVFVFHNPSAHCPFTQQFIWAFLDHFPQFAIAVGQPHAVVDLSDAKAIAQAENDSERHLVVIDSRNSKLGIEMDSQEHHHASLQQVAKKSGIEGNIPELLKKHMFVLVRIGDIKLDEEEKAAADMKEKNPLQAKQEQEQLFYDRLDKKVLEMLHSACTIKEVASFKRLWIFVSKIPAFSINPEGTILYCDKGNAQVSLMALFKECLRQPAPPRALVTASKRKKQDASQRVNECTPFVVELLRDQAFPAYLIKNTLLLDAARKFL